MLARVFVLALIGVSVAARGSVLFSFDNASIHSPLPLQATSDDGSMTAQLSATGQGFAIQDANTMGFTPPGFSGLCIYPSSINSSDLLVSFSQTVTDFSILYAPDELACDSSALMRVTAFRNGTQVGTNTTTADPPGTWPSATLSFSLATGFNSVVVHYAAPPPTGGDYGQIFMADNMNLTPAPVPEPASMITFFAAVPLLLLRRRSSRKCLGFH